MMAGRQLIEDTLLVMDLLCFVAEVLKWESNSSTFEIAARGRFISPNKEGRLVPQTSGDQ